MSIINDALKKVQQSQSTPPENKTPENKTAEKQSPWEAPPTNIYASTQPEKLDTPSKNQSPAQSKIMSVLALVCAVIITVVAAGFIYQQFQKNIPKVGTLTNKTLSQLIKYLPVLKPKAPAPKPLASLTINPVAANTANAEATDVDAPKPVTLNIHGVMANDSGNLVLINDQIYQQGDVVDGAKIVKIDLDAVTVSVNGKEQTIQVGQ